MTASAAPAALLPVTASERIVAVDIVRGFALWGVLLINMMNYASRSSGPIDDFADWARQFFFEQKSWRLFSFLFGFGFALLMIRASDRGARFLPMYARRLALLLGFGFFNFLFYFGDILTPYALLGVVLIVFQRWSPRWILLVAALLLLVHPMDRTIQPEIRLDPEAAAETARVFAVAGSDYRGEEVRERVTGSVFAYWGVQARGFAQHADPRGQWRGSETWLLFFAMFLLGLYAGKRRIIQDVERHRALIRRVFFWGLPLGLLAMTADWIFRDFVSAPLPWALRFAKEAVWAYGASALSLSYAAGLVLLSQQPRWKPILAPLGAMGQTALTVYLTQSIIFSTLFLGYGFGQYDRVGPAGIFGYAALIYAAQLAICVWWVKRFQFGPAEWLWRTLTYLRLQPMRLRRTVIAGTKALTEEPGT
jgi:uncharacterized protein